VAFLEKPAEKHETMKQRLIGGGNTTGVAPEHFSNLSNITNTATMMKRE
jgi:hypothetical protein